MKPKELVYKSYCWCLGTTSFRTKDFNRKIEEQLSLLKEFFNLQENKKQDWKNNNELQKRYYEYILTHGFVMGSAQRRDKDAREKTSGLVDLGLIDENRRLTEAGLALLNISLTGHFETDNFLRIPQDCFIYLKQILKTSILVDSKRVRPLIILFHLLSDLEYLTVEEFTFLLPLCVDLESTDYIQEQVKEIRNNRQTVDNVIISTLLKKENYRNALKYWIDQTVSVDAICAIGLNRKSRKYDVPYTRLYECLYSVFVEQHFNEIPNLMKSIDKINIGKWWRNYLFNTTSKKEIARNPLKCIKENVFLHVRSEDDFKRSFFKLMHLFKAKSTLSDYYDLNKRYIRTTGVVLFDGDTVKLDVVPKQFFCQAVELGLYKEAFSASNLLHKNCDLIEISSSLVYNEKQMISKLSKEFGKSIGTINEAYSIVEHEKYKRFNVLVRKKFPDNVLLDLLDKIEHRQDDDVNEMVTDNADIPTIFEYILGIIWYKVSNMEGKILEYLKLSLDADLLPITHAAGGEADLVYQYGSTDVYPAHEMLLEATLSEGSNQRRMEMEPVSRHLGKRLLDTRNTYTYCIFVTNKLHINVISDFMSRRHYVYCNPQDPSKCVDGMKIIPLAISDLREIIWQKKRYPELYERFEQAFRTQETHPKTWYDNHVKIQSLEKAQ